MKKDYTGKMLGTAAILLTLILCSSPVLAYYQTVTPWPMWHYDPAHTASSPSSAPNSNTMLWTTGGGWYGSPPTVAGGLVFALDNGGTMHCFDETTGVEFWTKHFTGYFVGEPAAVGDRIYAGTDANYMYVLNAADGTRLQDFQGPPGNSPTSPAVSNGNIYFGSTDGYLYALDADSSPLWSYHAGGSIRSSPAVDNSGVYFGCDDGKIYGLDATGTKKWEFYTGYNGTDPGWDFIHSSPCVSSDMVFVGSCRRLHSFYAINKTSGASIWNYTLMDSGATPKSLGFSEGFVYSTAGTKVYKLLANATSGSYQETDVNIRKGVYDVGSDVSEFSLAGDKLFVSSWGTGTTYALNTTSALSQVWSYTFPNAVGAGPTVADGRVFVPTWGSGLACFGEPFPPVTYYYTISAGGADWNLALSINATPSSTLNSSQLISQKTLSYTLQGITNTTGMSNISIPVGMLGGPFTSITVDGGPPIYTETTANDTYSFIYLTYNHSAHTVEIIGSTVVPEFPTLAPLAILMSATIMVSLFAHHFRRKKPT